MADAPLSGADDKGSGALLPWVSAWAEVAVGPAIDLRNTLDERRGVDSAGMAYEEAERNGHRGR